MFIFSSVLPLFFFFLAPRNSGTVLFNYFALAFSAFPLQFFLPFCRHCLWQCNQLSSWLRHSRRSQQVRRLIQRTWPAAEVFIQLKRLLLGDAWQGFGWTGRGRAGQPLNKWLALTFGLISFNLQLSSAAVKENLVLHCGRKFAL